MYSNNVCVSMNWINTVCSWRAHRVWANRNGTPWRTVIDAYKTDSVTYTWSGWWKCNCYPSDFIAGNWFSTGIPGYKDSCGRSNRCKHWIIRGFNLNTVCTGHRSDCIAGNIGWAIFHIDPIKIPDPAVPEDRLFVKSYPPITLLETVEVDPATVLMMIACTEPAKLETLFVITVYPVPAEFAKPQ